MIKAIFLDFYGTVVHEDGAIIKDISKRIYNTGKVKDISDIGSFWWKEFCDLFENSFGETFQTQRELEFQSLKRTIEHFQSTEDASELSKLMFEHWVAPPIFEESIEFFNNSPIPICIVSNIDTDDVKKALDYHNLHPQCIVTSEDARSYKPRKEIFKYALDKMNLSANEVVHIGDSLSSDVEGAKRLGINTIWINRKQKDIPDGALATVTNLLEVFDKEIIKGGIETERLSIK